MNNFASQIFSGFSTNQKPTPPVGVAETISNNAPLAGLVSQKAVNDLPTFQAKVQP